MFLSAAFQGTVDVPGVIVIWSEVLAIELFPFNYLWKISAYSSETVFLYTHVATCIFAWWAASEEYLGSLEHIK